MAKGTINLHGHSDGRLKPLPPQTDVGVDVRDFLPVRLTEIIQRKIATARMFSPAEWQRQSLFHRLRNGVARLGQPYL